jgi:hypothetical protein
MKVQPKENYHMGIGYPKLNKNCIYNATIATNQPDYIEKEKVFVKDILLEKDDYWIRYSLTEELLEDELLHGSGIDCKWEIEDKSNYWKCVNAFHCLNENGYYCGYADFTLIIPKKNPLDFKLHFNGKQSAYLNSRYLLRDYLEDTFHYELSEMLKRLNEFELERNDYIVLYRIESIMSPLDAPFGFECKAIDSDKAEEQCLNEYPDCAIVWVVETKEYQLALQDYWKTNN